MKGLLANLKISVPEKIYVKDPESSGLGKRIVEHSILMINEVGFEAFTFKRRLTNPNLWYVVYRLVYHWIL